MQARKDIAIDDADDTETDTESDWVPPNWRYGLDYRDEPWTPTEVASTVKALQKPDKNGDRYLTASRTLTPKARALPDGSTKKREIIDAAHNENELRDAWNTPTKAWMLAASFLPSGHGFTVDPFWNPATTGLPKLARMLDGSAPDKDGCAIDESRNAVVLERLKSRGIIADDETVLPKGEGFPAHWRGDLKQGRAAAAVNGRHSNTKQWLALSDAYGQEEFVAAFTPYRGDKWLWKIGYRANIVIHLGRAKCAPPPGIKESQPSGSSLLLFWVPPEHITDAKKYARLPEHTRRVLAGEQLIVPYRPRHDVLVAPGNVTKTVDIGMLNIDARA